VGVVIGTNKESRGGSSSSSYSSVSPFVVVYLLTLYFCLPQTYMDESLCVPYKQFARDKSAPYFTLFILLLSQKANKRIFIDY